MSFLIPNNSQQAAASLTKLIKKCLDENKVDMNNNLNQNLMNREQMNATNDSNMNELLDLRLNLNDISSKFPNNLNKLEALHSKDLLVSDCYSSPSKCSSSQEFSSPELSVSSSLKQMKSANQRSDMMKMNSSVHHTGSFHQLNGQFAFQASELNVAYLGENNYNLDFNLTETACDEIEEQEDKHVTKLFVGNLPTSTTLPELLAVFKRFGPVNEKLSVVKDQNYAFIHFYNREDAKVALQEINDSLFKDRYIRVQFSTSQGYTNKNKNKKSENPRQSKKYIYPSMHQSQSSMFVSSFAYSHNAKNNNSAFLRPITNGKLSHSLSSTFVQQQKSLQNQFAMSSFKPIAPSSSTNLLIESSKLNRSTSSYTKFDQQRKMQQILNLKQKTPEPSQTDLNRSNFENTSGLMNNFSRNNSFNNQYELIQQQKSFLLSDLSSFETISSNMDKKWNEKNFF